MHACTHALISITLIDALTGSLTHSYMHANTHSLTHSLMHSYIHALTHALAHALTNALTHALTPLNIFDCIMHRLFSNTEDGLHLTRLSLRKSSLPVPNAPKM